MYYSNSLAEMCVRVRLIVCVFKASEWICNWSKGINSLRLFFPFLGNAGKGKLPGISIVVGVSVTNSNENGYSFQLFTPVVDAFIGIIEKSYNDA